MPVDTPMLTGPDGQLPLPWLDGPVRRELGRQRAHALLLQAAPGDGALAFALALAQAWLCEAPRASGAPMVPACGQCAACRLVQTRGHPDLFVLLPQALRVELGWPIAGDEDFTEGSAKKKPSRVIRIDDVRAAADWVHRSGSRSPAKVLVLHPADTLNEQAANALLKTLEEPPAGTRMLLSCEDPALLLPTVRSRCQRVPLARPSPAEALAWLAQHDVAGAEVLLAAAGGHPLDALALARDGVDAAAWVQLPAALAAGRPAFGGWPLVRVMGALRKLCHDVMARSAGGSPLYFPPDTVPRVASLRPLVTWAEQLSRVTRHEDHPWSEARLVEALRAAAREALGGGAPSPARRLPHERPGRSAQAADNPSA